MRPLVCVALFILLCTSTSVRGVGLQISCKECTDFVDVLDDVIDPNSPIDVIEAVADAFCLLTKAEPLEVCLGIIHEFAPIFKYVFSQKPVAEAVCAELRYCTPFAEEPEDHERVQDAFFLRRALQRKLARVGSQATLRNKAAVHETTRVSPLARLKKAEDPTIGYAFHISDMHYDPNYIAGTSVDCGYPLCCHGGVGDSQPFGSYGCDTPLALLHSTFTAMAKVLPDPDYIIFTGDVPPHNVWNQTTAYNLNASIESSGVLYQYFPKAQVLYALGNHEVFPVDQDNGPGNNTWFTSGLRPLWLPWLSESDAATWSYAAYYTTLLSPGHRLISLDTNYCIVQNFYLVLSSVNDAYYDLGQQLKWLNTTLAAARAAQEHVWVLGHVPIGGWDCVDWYSNALYDIISTYPDVVSSAFMGHTHMDQLHIMRSNDSARTPLVPVYVSPAITPENGNNPTFRIYEFNRTTGELLDYTQYIGNLSDTDANGPAWQVLYTAKNFFSIPDLSAASWADFAYRAINSTAVLQNYCNIWYTGRGAEMGCADPGTLRSIECQFFSQNAAEQLSCLRTGPQ